MKKLVLIEDAPWRAEKNLKRLKEDGIEIERILFFTRGEDIPEEYKEQNAHLEESLGVRVDEVNTVDFYRVLDQYYGQEDVFMIVDLNLDDANTFEERINVQYANSKENKGQGKIWFYTTGGKDLKSMLVQNFREQLIDVIGFSENQISWDTDEILEIAGEG